MATIGTLAVKMALQAGSFVSDMNKQSKSLQKFKADAQAVGGALSLHVSAPLVAAGAASVHFARQLNMGMANVATLMPGATARVQELKGAVQETAIVTGKSTSDIAGGLFDVVSAFGDSADTAKVLDINARAAAAGMATTKESIALTSAVTKAYGDTSAGAVQHVADLAFKTNELGQTTFPEIASAMLQVTAISEDMGLSQERLFAVMATGTGVTGNASGVATQLRSALVSLQAPSDALTDLLTASGFASGKAAMAQLGLQGTMKLIVNETKKTGKPMQEYLGRVEAQTLATLLTGKQANEYTRKLGLMSNVQGAMVAGFDAQTGGINKVGFAMSRMTTRAQVLLEKMGDGLLPTLGKVVDMMTPVVNMAIRAADWFGRLPQPVKDVTVGLIAVAAAAGPVLLALGSVSSVIPIVTAGVSVLKFGLLKLGPAWAVATGPIGLAVAAVVGLSVVWAKWGQDIIKITGTAIDFVLGKINLWITGVNSIVRSVNDWAGTSIPQMKKFKTEGDTLGKSFVDSVGGMDQSVRDFASGMFAAKASVSDSIAPVKTLAGGMTDLSNSAVGATGSMKKVSTQARQIIEDAKEIGKTLKGLKLWTPIELMAANMEEARVNEIARLKEELKNNIPDAIDETIAASQNMKTHMVTDIGFFTEVFNVATGTWKTRSAAATTAMSTAFRTNFIDIVQGDLSSLSGIFGGFLGGMKQKLSGFLADKVVSGFSSFLTGGKGFDAGSLIGGKAGLLSAGAKAAGLTGGTAAATTGAAATTAATTAVTAGSSAAGTAATAAGASLAVPLAAAVAAAFGPEIIFNALGLGNFDFAKARAEELAFDKQTIVQQRKAMVSGLQSGAISIIKKMADGGSLTIDAVRNVTQGAKSQVGNFGTANDLKFFDDLFAASSSVLRGNGGGVNLEINITGSVGVDDIGEQLVQKLRDEGFDA